MTRRRRRRRRRRRPEPASIVLALAGAVLVGVLVVVATSDDDGGDASADRSATTEATSGVDGLRTVVIGDSGISGGGAAPYDPEALLCFRSERSWPRQLATMLDGTDADVRIDIVEDRSCGGATVDQLLAPWPDRGQPAQVPPPASGEDPDVDLVLVEIGGNDFGLGELVIGCATGDCAAPRDPAATEAAVAELTDRLTRLEERLVDDVHPALRAAYPDARIVQVAYPRPVPSAGRPVVGCRWLTDGEPAVLNDAVEALNDTLARAVRRSNAAPSDATSSPIELVATFDALAGHELCSADPWVHPLGTAEQAHATAEGYAAIAAAVAEQLPDLLDA